MKFIRFLVLLLFVFPLGLRAAQSDFMVAAQLLAAARNADIQQVQSLVNNGADVNFVDSTGLSLVCTALMNNDTRAAQILQMYGADASKCDRQIKQYKNRTKPERSGGLFSGLSSAQSMTLTAAGAAVVVGGLLFLTDVFDPGNENKNAASNGNRPGGNGDSSGGEGTSTAAFQLPIGPACAADGTCSNDLSEWGADSSLESRVADFNYMSGFNYLMMAYAYNAFVRGYLGMETVRLVDANTPFKLNSLPFAGSTPGGGKPINVATITSNGANATGSLGDGFLTWVDGTKILNAQSICSSKGADSSACQEALAALTHVSRKFYNRTNLTSVDDTTERSGFDYSGHDTVFGAASDLENLNLKVIAGWEAGGRPNGDAYGFLPNAQLTVYRTGNGFAVDETVGVVNNATDATEWASEDTFTLNGETYTVTINENNNTFVATSSGQTVNGTVDGAVLNFALEDGTNYEAQFGGNVNLLKVIDVKNFNAMLNAAQIMESGKPWVNVIANIAQNPAASDSGYLTARGYHALASQMSTDALKLSGYLTYIDQYYNLNTADDDATNKPSIDAATLYTTVGNYQNQIIVNSAGAYEYGVGEGMSIEALGSTFENYAPVLYPSLEHLFVTVVAVTNTEGTSGIKDISSYASSGGKLVLSKWGVGRDTNGTDITTDDTYEHVYASRKCGLSVNGGLDPWCFAAPGMNAEMAVSSMAGAIGAVQGAFNSMTIGGKALSNKQIFTLLALTADGPYLGTNPGSGTGWTNEEDLVAYLQSKYDLPPEYSGIRIDEYLDAFKDVFGYGAINLERATRPGTKVYYYNGTDIVAADGVSANAYWRAATNTVFKASSAFNLSGERVSAAVFDVLESADGSMRMPRVWANEFEFNNSGKRGLYMGDVLGDLRTHKNQPATSNFGDMAFSISVSERAYIDNLNGLDSLVLSYNGDNWNMNASFQHYFTDGVSRFTGMVNPVLNLASNVVTTGAEYKTGNWSFGGRGYSGFVTDESLLENDPTITAQYMPGKLGHIGGMESHVGYKTDKFGFVASVGSAHESDTLLGAMTDGLLDLGAGDTTYIDVLAHYSLFDDVDFMARATFARTVSDVSGAFVLGMDEIESSAFSLGANVGNWEFALSCPLAVTSGAVMYAHAQYDVVESADGMYDIVVNDARVAELSLRPDVRETRLSGTYRHSFGEYTDGAIGFIYRINPNHTGEFGNESIFMLKMSHRLGV